MLCNARGGAMYTTKHGEGVTLSAMQGGGVKSKEELGGVMMSKAGHEVTPMVRP